jgi:hypothetical protein
MTVSLVHDHYFVAVPYGDEMAALVINVPFESCIECLSFYVCVSCLGLIRYSFKLYERIVDQISVDCLDSAAILADDHFSSLPDLACYDGPHTLLQSTQNHYAILGRMQQNGSGRSLPAGFWAEEHFDSGPDLVCNAGPDVTKRFWPNTSGWILGRGAF